MKERRGGSIPAKRDRPPAPPDDHPRPASGHPGAERSARREAGARDGGLLVPVRVLPRASRDELMVEGDGLRARLTAPPVDGAANDALVALLADRLRIPRRAVELVRGASSRQKLVAISGLDWEGVRRRIEGHE